MRRGGTRRVPCGRALADTRLKQAEAFALVADLDPLSADGPLRSVAVSNAVLAGIAAVDSICCKYLGQRSAAGHHSGALVLLTDTPGGGQDAGAHLSALLAMKNMAQYEDRHPSVPETKRAIRAMRALIRIARLS